MNLKSPRTKNRKYGPFPRRVPLAIRVDRCEGRICSFLLCAVILFVLLHHVEVIVGILAVVNVLKLLLLVLPSTAIKRLEEGEQRLLKRIHSTLLRLRLLRPLRRRHLALPAHEGYILRQLAAPYSMWGRVQKCVPLCRWYISRVYAPIYIEAADYWSVLLPIPIK